MSAGDFDLIVYGASGYTGRLVAEHLAQHYRRDPALKWAMAGRSEEKLAKVREEIGAPPSTPLLIADASDPRSLKHMAARTKIVLTTVGPYQLYGSALVAACTESGTDYVDLCGEPGWMRAMIETHETTAKKTGARVVFSCGFDSIPFDLGVFFLQNEANRRFGGPCADVKARVRKMKGALSGGTVASLKATMAAHGDPEAAKLLNSPFALTPGFEGPQQPSDSEPQLDEDVGAWVAPFIMAPINTKNIHRSNLLLGHAYGTDFRYSEMLVTGSGERGEKIATAIVSDNVLMHDDAPKPGAGPTAQERESGYYDILFIGKSAHGHTIRASVAADIDPGYGSTSKMIAESALCLLREPTTTPGGIWTPASAMGSTLIRRLQHHAGLSFRIE